MNNLYIQLANLEDSINELEKRLKSNIQNLQKQILEIKTIVDNLSSQQSATTTQTTKN